MKRENISLDAMQDIGCIFNGTHQYGVSYHAVLSEDLLGRKTALCGFLPHINGNGWGWAWDIKKVNCRGCLEKINYTDLKMDTITFKEKTLYIGKKYYPGRLIRWMIADKKGESIYCFRCRNIANQLVGGKLFGFIKYTIPVCQPHIEGRK